jgi:hypothetical protein
VLHHGGEAAIGRGHGRQTAGAAIRIERVRLGGGTVVVGEAQARGAIDTNADRLKLRINDATQVVDQGTDTVGDAFDARVKQALARLGYPKTSKTKK